VPPPSAGLTCLPTTAMMQAGYFNHCIMYVTSFIQNKFTKHKAVEIDSADAASLFI
jgi:hypothetical protein